MPTRMQFQFLDVGMGDGTFVVMGSGKNQELALIDFGVQPFTKFKQSADDAMLYLKRTIAEISKTREKDSPYLDHLFITHPDQDHYNRIRPLVEATDYPGYAGKDLDIGRITFGGRSQSYRGLIGRLRLHSDTVDDLTNSQRSLIQLDKSVTPFVTFVGGNIKVYLLSSNFPTKASKANPCSLCLLFQDPNNNKVILLGDAEADVETSIRNYYKDATAGFLNATGLKLGHHGSLNGTSKEWLQATNPKAIFASGDFVWAHPYCPAIQRVIDNNSLQKSPMKSPVRYCCGESGGEYFNKETDLNIYLNLWYVVKEPDALGRKMEQTEDDQVVWVANGTTWGVQWEMEFNGASATVGVTERANPVKN